MIEFDAEDVKNVELIICKSCYKTMKGTRKLKFNKDTNSNVPELAYLNKNSILLIIIFIIIYIKFAQLI